MPTTRSALAGQVRPGDTVAVVGAGAVGLSAILTTGLWGALKVIAIDTNKFRPDKALEFGATDAVEAGATTVADVTALTDGLGVDVSIEAVGYPETLLTAASLVRPGGTIANVGVHGVPVELPMQEMWIQNVTLTGREDGDAHVHGRSNGRRLRRVQERGLELGPESGHHARLSPRPNAGPLTSAGPGGVTRAGTGER